MNIYELMQAMTSFWYKSDGAKRESIFSFEHNYNLLLPHDFKKFLIWSNGGQGKFPAVYVDIWRIEDIESKNKGYNVSQFLGKEFLAFGSDGGPVCFLFDYRTKKDPSVVACSFGAFAIEEIQFISNTFTVFLEHAINGTLTDDDL